jgi:hypothetical protein
VFSRAFCQFYRVPFQLRAGSLRAKVQAPYRGYSTTYVHTVSFPLLAIIFPCVFGGANTGPNRTCPTTLVFGVYPAIDSQVPPTQQNRDGVPRKARIMMQQIVSSRNMKEALRALVISGVEEVYIPGELVLVFREKERRWIGPFSVHDATARLITVVNDH